MTIRRLLTPFKYARETGAWRPSRASLLLEQVVGRNRNQHAGLTDADHLRVAAEWLERAQDATGNGGVAGRYRLKSGWTAAYPETTGYIIPTFLALAEEPWGSRFTDRARQCVEFLLTLQFPSGAFPGGELRDGPKEPSFFNTGQIIAGLIAWHRATGDARAIGAARLAADWLLTLQDGDGAFRRHLYNGVVTTYGAHASCWLAELGQHTGEARYLDAARRHVDWVLTKRDTETGWIDLCGFSEEHHRARRAVTHTIAYTLWGILATARIVGHTEGIAAVTQASLGIARRLELSGWLPGVLDHTWRPAATFSCLTGNAQLALIWFALHEHGNDSRFLNAALKAIDLVKRAQPMQSSDPGILGGIPGSDPIWGDYISKALPNWSAKFFIDALLKKRAVLAELPSRPPGADTETVAPDALPDITSSGTADPIRVVVLATPTSKKAVQMLRTWDWGFRPSAVVLLSRQPRPPMERLLKRVKEDGLAFLFHRRASRNVVAAGHPAGYSEADVRSFCQTNGIPTLELDSLEHETALEAIRGLQPDLFVFAGGAILRAPLLAIPRLGTLNAHMGLLPFYRGMNVAEWACFHRDTIGCTVHLIDSGIDTGDILCVREVATTGVRSIAALRQLLDQAQMALLSDAVRYITLVGELPPRRPQKLEEGRQFFRMHRDLSELLEQTLAAGLEPQPRRGQREPL